MISKQEVRRIAKLARLGLTEKEVKLFQKELSSILDYFNSLKKVDTSKVKPVFRSAEKLLRKKPEKAEKSRPESRPEKNQSKLIKAFPEKEKSYLKVKPIF